MSIEIVRWSDSSKAKRNVKKLNEAKPHGLWINTNWKEFNE